VALVEQELLILSEFIPVFSGVRVAQSFVLCIIVCPFVFFLLAIVLSVLRFTAADYLFGIFKIFFFFSAKTIYQSTLAFQLLKKKK
jgi:hypothetical protein